MKKIIKISIGVILALACMICIYSADYYHSDAIAKKALETKLDNVTIIEEEDRISYVADDSDIALIFYPGGKVEYSAYCPLASELAKQGISVFICHMPLNLAVLNVNAADKVFANYPEIKNWYIGGHSLGGAMAASYAAENSDKLIGLILLAGYSTVDLNKTSVKVLSVYGSNDEVMNKEKYSENYHNLINAREVVIEGGCHGYFGSYGMQKGDGKPTITFAEQLAITVFEITNFMK